jgi:hypothetical protein
VITSACTQRTTLVLVGPAAAAAAAVLHACRRKSPYTPRYNSGAPKSTGKKKNYWDTVDWDAPLRSIVPDKWYVRVAWLLLIVGVAVYVNWHYGSAGTTSTYGHVVDSSSGLAGLL